MPKRQQPRTDDLLRPLYRPRDVDPEWCRDLLIVLTQGRRLRFHHVDSAAVTDYRTVLSPILVKISYPARCDAPEPVLTTVWPPEHYTWVHGERIAGSTRAGLYKIVDLRVPAREVLAREILPFL